jgi:putative transcriptional regulator
MRVGADGRRQPIEVPVVKAGERVDLADPDNPQLTPEMMGKLKPVPRVKTLRRALGLTQEEFASRYRIPLGTLRDWELGRAEPDQPARAYLIVIASDPERAAKALAKESA